MSHFSGDQEDIVECPYDPLHKVMKKRLQAHIIKCGLSHPDIKLLKCPFNAVHLLSEAEYRHHTLTCPDRISVTSFQYESDISKPYVKISTPEKIECDEEWDDIDEQSYDPNKYKNQDVIVKTEKEGVLPSERKVFRAAERIRRGIEDVSDDE